ncbi:MAG: hypothetical protein Q7S33_02035 [Nanoarchaeota archaeon]|nr:hypothetical protein [Nanoarchaeota archaeon]
MIDKTNSIEDGTSKQLSEEERSLIVDMMWAKIPMIGRNMRNESVGLPYDASDYQKSEYERAHSNYTLQQVLIEASDKREQPCPI